MNDGFQRRYEQWLSFFNDWCKKHTITKVQGLSILSEWYATTPKITHQNLIDWAEFNEFIEELTNEVEQEI